MPKGKDAKTESEHSVILKLFSVGIVVLLLLMAMNAWLPVAKLTVVRYSDHRWETEIAETTSKQKKGLSERSYLAPDHAMLFVLDGSNDHACFWMKDMLFNIDIIWLDKDQKVTYIKEDASPADYPETYCQSKPTNYVLEVNAGTVKAVGLKIGDHMSVANR